MELTDIAPLDTWRELEQRILSEAGSILELPPEEVVLVPPHAVPKTSSGKIRRAFIRELYETGRLGQQDRANWPKLAGLILAGWTDPRRGPGQPVGRGVAQLPGRTEHTHHPPGPGHPGDPLAQDQGHRRRPQGRLQGAVAR